MSGVKCRAAVFTPKHKLPGFLFSIYLAVDGPFGGTGGSFWSDGPSGSKVYLNGHITAIEVKDKNVWSDHWYVTAIRARCMIKSLALKISSKAIANLDMVTCGVIGMVHMVIKLICWN